MPLNNEIAARNDGSQAIQYLRKRVTFTDDGGTVTVGKIPAGSIILKGVSGVQVVTAFDAGTGNVLDIGTSDDADVFGTDLALDSAGFVECDENVSGYYVSSETTITASVDLTGTAATAGDAHVLIAYATQN